MHIRYFLEEITMKKITALLLALVMVLPLAFAACDGGSNLPPTGTSGETEADGKKPSDTTGKKDDQNEGPYVYTPTADALYPGMVGVGSNGSAVEFESVKVTNRADKHVLVDNDFSGEDPLAGWSFATAVGGAWAGESAKADFEVTEPTSFAEEAPATGEGTGEDTGSDTQAPAATPRAADEKVLAFKNKSGTGSMAFFGDPQWNYIQFAVKARILDEDGNGFVIYFSVKDEKNYKELIVGDKGNTYVTVNSVDDGTKTQLAQLLFKVNLPTSTAENWIPCSITFNKETINVFVNGVGVCELYAKEETIDNPMYGGVGLGTWATGVSYDNLVVKSNVDGKVLYENNFDKVSSIEADFTPGNYGVDGSWSTMDDWLSEWVVVDDDAEHGKVLSMTNKTPTGDAVMITNSVNNADWSDITIDVDARIDLANEGWLIVFNAKDEKNSIFWNIGGWGNTVTCFQSVENGTKSGQQEAVSAKYTTGQWYHITLVVKPATVYAYIDGYLLAVHSVA